LSENRSGTPKQRDGRIEALRNLRVARRPAVDQRADAPRRIKALIVTAPDEPRQRLRGMATTELILTCAALRPDRGDAGTPVTAAQTALRSLARRHQQHSIEITDLDELLDPLVAAISPNLVTAHGVGTDTAGQLLVTAGENHDRLRSEATFAMLCGVAPIPASSGKTNRHSPSRSGDRHATAALYRVTHCRLRWDPRTRAYVERRTKEGMSEKEIIRCRKRYIARKLYRLITSEPARAPLDIHRSILRDGHRWLRSVHRVSGDRAGAVPGGGYFSV
jgi:hypothetical protein